MEQQTTIKRGRVDEIDFLKAVFIVLMIAFHLTLIGNSYPYAKQIVYTFHMPGFLLISGFLASTSKQSKAFARSMWWIFVPYLVMEVGYTVMASMLPIRDHVAELTLGVILKNALLTPLGPYWYLHTLIICSTALYVVFHIPSLSDFSRFIILGLVLYVLADGARVISFSNACYFMAGAVLRRSWSRVPFFFSGISFGHCAHRNTVSLSFQP